jgi:hypothetical protein
MRIFQLTGTAKLRVYRITKAEDVDDPALVDDFRSHYETGKPPRNVEEGWAVVHMGISCFRTEGAAASTARFWPVIGDHVAAVDLGPGEGFNIAETGSAQHLTIWGDPVKLAAAVEEIRAVAEIGAVS